MNWIKNLLSEGDAVSSKRFIGILGAFVLLTMLIINSFQKTLSLLHNRFQVGYFNCQKMHPMHVWQYYRKYFQLNYQ